MNIFFVFFSLFGFAILNAIIFFILCNKNINFKETLKLTILASALNKLFFTGSGYLASSYLYRDENITSSKIFTAFLFLEFFSVSFWIFLGIYFGAELVIRLPIILVLGVIGFSIMVWVKKNKFGLILKDLLIHFRNIGNKLFLIMPFVLLNMAVYAIYYFFLFRCFNFYLDVTGIIKIVAVSFTLGYLSFAPAGIGFKDTGLVLLLIGQGIALDGAIMFALADRLIVTFFWAGLGSLVGFDLIKEEFKKRFKREKY